jgi:hypothetical protein
LHIVILPKFASILFYHERRMHQQGDGKKDEEEGEFKFKSVRLSICIEIIMRRKNRNKW